MPDPSSATTVGLPPLNLPGMPNLAQNHDRSREDIKEEDRKKNKERRKEEKKREEKPEERDRRKEEERKAKVSKEEEKRKREHSKISGHPTDDSQT